MAALFVSLKFDKARTNPRTREEKSKNNPRRILVIDIATIAFCYRGAEMLKKIWWGKRGANLL